MTQPPPSYITSPVSPHEPSLGISSTPDFSQPLYHASVFQLRAGPCSWNVPSPVLILFSTPPDPSTSGTHPQSSLFDLLFPKSELGETSSFADNKQICIELNCDFIITMLKFTDKHMIYQGLPSTQSSALHLLWSQIPNKLIKDQAHIKRNRLTSKNLQ